MSERPCDDRCGNVDEEGTEYACSTDCMLGTLQVHVFTEADAEVLRIVGEARVTDDSDSCGLMDYDDE